MTDEEDYITGTCIIIHLLLSFFIQLNQGVTTLATDWKGEKKNRVLVGKSLGNQINGEGGFYFLFMIYSTASVVQWSEFLAIDSEDPGSIPGATRFPWSLFIFCFL
jgi:hypothetical protein